MPRTSDVDGKDGQTAEDAHTSGKNGNSAKPLRDGTADASFGRFHARFLAFRLSLAGNPDDEVARTISSSSIDLRPHQVESAVFAVGSPLSADVLLADEVGLGKTIEAGIVIAQKWAEGRRRILIVAPTSLVPQWQDELRVRFGLEAAIVGRHKSRKAKSRAGADEPEKTLPVTIPVDCIVIMSLTQASKRAADVRRIAWDMVVIDEAHGLRNVLTAGRSAHSQRLREALSGRRKLLLTATPIQNRLSDFLGLVSIIDERLVGADELAMLRVKSPSKDIVDHLREAFRPFWIRHLRRDVEEAGHVRFTKRYPKTVDVCTTDIERQLYERLSDYLANPKSRAFGHAKHLVLLGGRKILGSSVAAVEAFLGGVRERLIADRLVDETIIEDLDGLAGVEGERKQFVDGVEPVHSEKPNEIRTDDLEHDPLDSCASMTLREEIALIDEMLELARSIRLPTKTRLLIETLPVLLDEIVARQGERRAVIFTESVCSQFHLRDALSRSGYAGKIVLLNGSNNDRDARAILQSWQARHPDVSMNDRDAEMRAALIWAFRTDKTILISTEAGAEGLNLQHCSLVINYDLPWNPQRIEQRIGRCHRYGQKIDVAVVNLIDRSNETEERVFELLSQKFRLFDGMFGASDEIVGMLANGFDIEGEILRLVQRCRSSAEVRAAFAEIESRLSRQIEMDRAEATKRLTAHFDAEVVARLIGTNSRFEALISAHKRRLGAFIRAAVPATSFDARDPLRFAYRKRQWHIDARTAESENLYAIRLGQDGFVDRCIRAEKIAPELRPATVRFSYGDYKKLGLPELSDVKRQRGKSGWLKVMLLRSISEAETVETLAVVAVTDGGRRIHESTAERFFELPGRIEPLGQATEPPALDIAAAGTVTDIMQRLKNRADELLDQRRKELASELDAHALTDRIAIENYRSDIDRLRKEIARSVGENDKSASVKLERLEHAYRRRLFSRIKNRRRALMAIRAKQIEACHRVEFMVEQTEIFRMRWLVT